MIKFKQFLKEQDEFIKDLTILVLTKVDNGKLSETVQHLDKVCKKLKIKCYPIDANKAYVDPDFTDNPVIHNYINGKDLKNINLKNTVCFVRGGTLTTPRGTNLLSSLQDSGIFMINDKDTMKLCANKLETYLRLEKNNIDTPRTVFIDNVDDLDDSLNKIGNKFPIIIKLIQGAEGIGVSKVDSYDSLKSVLQTIWKQGGVTILQEYKPIDYDVRTLVLNGEIIAATKRNKVKSDFRTNKALGSKIEPYNLTENEKKIVLRSAKSIGNGYYLGVDHIVSKGKPYILEVNGSPGSGSIYLTPDNKKITGEQLVEKVVKYITDKSKWKLIPKQAGKIEYVKLPELTNEIIKAKLDTGNGTYNVLNATDIVLKGNKVTFKSFGKTFTKPIVDVKKIKTVIKNSDNDDIKLKLNKRSVIELDFIVDGKLYKDTYFTLSDRTGFLYPVLIGVDFLKQSNLSIDVNRRFILKGGEVK
jgi:ribosomal protein S6--L-glutamate ligase